LPPVSTPPRRAWRPALAALAIATGLCAPARAQEANPTPPTPPAQLGLKDGDGALSAQLPSLPSLPSQATDEPQPDAQTSKAKKKPIKHGAPTLPPLQAYHGAQRAGAPGGPPAPNPALTPAASVAVLPIHQAQQAGSLGGQPTPDPALTSPAVTLLPAVPAKHRPLPDDKPFDPVGVMARDIKLLPTIEEDVGYASNPSLLAGATKGSPYESTQAGLAFQSEWARSELKGSLSAGYADYFATPQANSPNGNGVIDGRLDVSRDLSVDTEGRFNLATQTPGSVSLPTGVVLSGNQRPLVETYGATLGGAQKFGDLALSLHGTLDRTQYQNATLAGGQVEDLASDDFNDWGLRARAAYQGSPVVAPFVETVIDTRRYDSAIDASGFARSSDGWLGRAGATLALTGQLTGEASLGYGARQYEDARLPDLRAPLVDASLIWTATPLTTLTLKASTNLNDTTNAGDSGAVTRSYTIDVAHAFWRNLTLGASAGYTTDVYAGVPLHDSTTSFGLRADYNVTRDIVLRASASRSMLVSSAPGTSYDANVFMLGLRLQR